MEKVAKPLSRRGGLYHLPNIQRGQDQNRRKLALVRIFLCRSLPLAPLSTRIQHVPGRILYVFKRLDKVGMHQNIAFQLAFET